MSIDLKQVKIAAGIFVVGAVLGMSLEWMILKPKPVPVPKPQAEIRQADGSLVLKNEPVASSEVKPKHQLPVGAKVTGTAEVILSHGASAGATTATSTTNLATNVSLPETKLDLTFFRLNDTERVSVSSTNAETGEKNEIISGVYHPVIETKTQKPLLWGLGVSRSVDWVTGRGVWGGVATRDLGPFRVGLNVNRDQALAMVMFKF